MTSRLYSSLLLTFALLYFGSRAWADEPPVVENQLDCLTKDGKDIGLSTLAWGGGSKNWYIYAQGNVKAASKYTIDDARPPRMLIYETENGKQVL